MELLRLAGLLSFESTKYQPKVQPTPEIPFSTSRPDRAAREMPYSIKMICIALLAVMIIAFIILFIYMTYKLMKKKRIKKKVEVEEVIETREKVEKVKRKAHKKNSLHGKDPAVMIRKLYRKHMHGFWVSTSVTKGDKTPSEQRILKNESGGNIPEEAIAIYEKIRYSDQEVTQQDVHALKQLFK